MYSEGEEMKPKITPYQLDDPELLELVSPEMDRWLNSWPAEEQARYGGQYVAVSREKRVVAADKSAARLQRKLEKLGLQKVRIFYMEPPGVCIIYALYS
jgi:hypothetical protein